MEILSPKKRRKEEVEEIRGGKIITSRMSKTYTSHVAESDLELRILNCLLVAEITCMYHTSGVRAYFYEWTYTWHPA